MSVYDLAESRLTTVIIENLVVVPVFDSISKTLSQLYRNKDIHILCINMYFYRFLTVPYIYIIHKKC